MSIYALWWVWVAAGLALAIVEILIPGFVFAGFAVGAVITGVVMGVGGPGAAWLQAHPANALLAFAIMSVLAWLGMRALFGVRHGQVKRIDRDINDD